MYDIFKSLCGFKYICQKIFIYILLLIVYLLSIYIINCSTTISAFAC